MKGIAAAVQIQSALDLHGEYLLLLSLFLYSQFVSSFKKIDDLSVTLIIFVILALRLFKSLLLLY